MTKHQNLVLLLMLITTLGLLEHDEMTKSTSMFRRKIRKKLNGFQKAYPDEYASAVETANAVWNKALDKFSDKKLNITVHDVILAIHTIVSGQKLTNKFYTEKQLDKLLNSIKHNSCISNEIYAETEKNTNMIIDEFVNELGIKRNTALKTRLYILKQNLILEGKIK